MARKSKRTSRRRQVKQSKKRAYTRKHYRKQHRRLRQRGGVSYDLSTIVTFGVPVVSMNDVAETSISVPGLVGQRTPKELQELAENGEGLAVDN